jgi:hypothetical protein
VTIARPGAIEDAIAYAHDIELEALRLLGTMLQETKRATGGHPYQKKSTPSKPEGVETLKSIGVDYEISMLTRDHVSAWTKLCARPCHRASIRT